MAAAAAMAFTGTQSTAVATAAPASAPRSDSGRVDPGALPAEVTPRERAALIREAERRSGGTARDLGLEAGVGLRVKDVVKNRDGATHTRYERVYEGLPVLGGQLIVHRGPDGVVDEVDKATEARIAPPTTLAPAARKPRTPAARNSLAPRKVVWAAEGTPALAWETVTGGTRKDGTPNELHIVTDASTGRKLAEFQGVQTGTGHSQYSGTVAIGTEGPPGAYTLTDTARGGHRTIDAAGGALFQDADDIWGDGDPAHRQTAAVDAHYGAALTWDYFKNVHQRNGIRGDGRAATSRVHYGNGYANAFWRDSCFCMTYGDGRNNQHPLTSIDVAAHEMTHGITSATAGLVYGGESGALNEATSDIFAAAVEFHAGNPEDAGDYLAGEKIDLNGNGTPLRHMDEPSKDGVSLDYWRVGAGTRNVHHSSGIANHFFYLLSEGSGRKTVNGVTYDSPAFDNRPVTGIGIAAAAKIWFKALTENMLANETFEDARTHTLKAAAGLYGVDSAEHQAVAHAWAAVNVGTRPGGPGTPGGPTFENLDDFPFADNGPAVHSPITVTGVNGNAPTALRVTVDIKHPLRGDVGIKVIAPDGTAYTLKNMDSGRFENVRETFAFNASSEIAGGIWKLQVRDMYPGDGTGFVDSWKLSF